MQEHSLSLIVLGVLFFTGLAADRLGRRLRLPRVTLLLSFGLVIGSSGLDLLPPQLIDFYPVVTVVALTAVALLLGNSLSLQNLRKHGKTVIVLSLAVVLTTQLVVSLGLWALGYPLVLAVVIGAFSTATDPAATYDVIDQSGRETVFTSRLKGLVAMDDVWGLLAFSLTILTVDLFLPGLGNSEGHSPLSVAVYELVGSVVLGCMIGIPGAFLSGRYSDGEPLRVEALGLIFLVAGLALFLDLSYLIAGMTTGAVIVNLARHHTRTFHEIKNFEWPFLIVFFILAGASLKFGSLALVGTAAVGYFVLRICGRLLGGMTGGVLVKVPGKDGIYFGAAMLPQAGVAIGMALAAAEKMPEYGQMITALAIGTTAGFELIGPILATMVIARQGRQPQSPGG